MALGLVNTRKVEDQEEEEPLRRVLDWCKTFLSHPHPDLGRPGFVCPFIPAAVRNNTLYFSLVEDNARTPEEVAAVCRSHLEEFLQLEPNSGRDSMFKAIVLVFPSISREDAPRLVDQVQASLKAEFRLSGLMLGELHPANMTPSSYNSAFYPNRSPVPSLAIRYMVQDDLKFLKQEPDACLRLRYIRILLANYDRFQVTAGSESDVLVVLRGIADELSAECPD